MQGKFKPQTKDNKNALVLRNFVNKKAKSKKG